MPRNSAKNYISTAEASRQAAAQLGMLRSQIDNVLIKAIGQNRIRMRGILTECSGSRDETMLIRFKPNSVKKPVPLDLRFWHHRRVMPVYLPIEQHVFKRSGVADEDSRVYVRKPKSTNFCGIIINSELLIADFNKVMHKHFHWLKMTKPLGLSRNSEQWGELIVSLLVIHQEGKLASLATNKAFLIAKMLEAVPEFDARSVEPLASYLMTNADRLMVEK